ncbi:MAG: isochorismatase family protein [Monoraphidium minutum]|nr:MAG: isochorismatase family protein [Monoraphidium minutum]
MVGADGSSSAGAAAPAAAPLVDAEPYAWPCVGRLSAESTAFIVIDMQVDFCGKGGYVDMMGYDISLTRAPIEPIKRVMDACRRAGVRVIHTREGHRPELADLPPNKLWRSKQIGAAIGAPGPTGRVLVRGEPGWAIIPELAPAAGEVVIDKPGKGSFYATDLDLVLRTAGITHIILAGITTDVCVHTTMRDANDMGYECLLLSDCTAATARDNHLAALDMVKKQGGVFGAVAASAALLPALAALPPRAAPAPSPPPAAAAAAATAVVASARPYPYRFPPGATALIMIDFQKDFLLPGGFGGALGNDVSLLMDCVPAAARLLAAARAARLPVAHTLEGHRPDLSDLHPSKAARGGLPAALRIGAKGPMGRILVAGEEGNAIIDELAPLPGEELVAKPGKGAFYATQLEAWLRGRGVTHLLIAGVTTEVCVQTTMREANDRGFECLLVTDATASYRPAFKEATIQMVVAQGGIVGWAARADDVGAALRKAAAA